MQWMQTRMKQAMKKQDQYTWQLQWSTPETMKKFTLKLQTEALVSISKTDLYW